MPWYFSRSANARFRCCARTRKVSAILSTISATSGGYCAASRVYRTDDASGRRYAVAPLIGRGGLGRGSSRQRVAAADPPRHDRPANGRKSTDSGHLGSGDAIAAGSRQPKDPSSLEGAPSGLTVWPPAAAGQRRRIKPWRHRRRRRAVYFRQRASAFGSFGGSRRFSKRSSIRRNAISRRSYAGSAAVNRISAL